MVPPSMWKIHLSFPVYYLLKYIGGTPAIFFLFYFNDKRNRLSYQIQEKKH